LVDEDEEMSSGGDDDDGSDKEDEDEEESSGEAESGESDSEEGDEAADDVRQKIKDALKANGMGIAEDSSEADSDEELMDDEQMMALDDTLANIFRARTNERKSKKGPWTCFLDVPFGCSVDVSRGRCPTRSDTLQEPSSRSRGYLCQAGVSESSQHPTRPTIGRTRDQEQHGRTPTI